MVLAVLPMVELVGVAEGVHDGLEDRLQNLGVAIYTKSIHKKFQEASSKITALFSPPPPVRVSSKHHSRTPPLTAATSVELLGILELEFAEKCVKIFVNFFLQSSQFRLLAK